MFLKNKNTIFKIRRSKVTDYAALSVGCLSNATKTSGYDQEMPPTQMFGKDTQMATTQLKQSNHLSLSLYLPLSRFLSYTDGLQNA